MKNLARLLFDEQVISAAHFAYLVRTRICLKPTFPPHFMDLDLSPIALKSLKVARVYSQIDSAVAASFYLSQFNKGYKMLDGIRFLQNLVGNPLFRINEFRKMIGVRQIEERTLQTQKTVEELVLTEDYEEIGPREHKIISYDPDIKVTDSDEAFIANLIIPRTNVLSYAHLHDIAETLKIVRSFDPSIRCLHDLLLHDGVPETEKSAARARSAVLPDNELEENKVLAAINAVVYNDARRQGLSSARVERGELLKTLSCIRQCLESETDLWPGQQPILKLARMKTPRKTTEATVYYVNTCFRHLFPQAIPVDSEIHSVGAFLGLLERHAKSVPQALVERFQYTNFAATCSQDVCVRNELDYKIDMASLDFSGAQKAFLASVLQRMLQLKASPGHPLTLLWTFVEFARANKVEMMQKTAFRPQSTLNISENGAYDLQFDRLLCYFNRFLVDQFKLCVKHIRTVTEFSSTLLRELHGFQIKDLLENEKFDVSALEQRVLALQNASLRCKNYSQPLITANIERIFTDTSFSGTNRALSLLLQINGVARKNGLVSNALALVASEQFEFRPPACFVFIVYATFLTLKAAGTTLRGLVERQTLVKTRRDQLRQQQRDDSIDFSNYDELVDFYRACKLKRMQIMGGVVYTSIMNRQLLEDEVEEYFGARSACDWYDFVKAHCQEM